MEVGMSLFVTKIQMRLASQLKHGIAKTMGIFVMLLYE
jgi:hypothetical protein